MMREGLEQRWGAANLVDDDELSALCPQEGVRVPQAALIDGPLEIQIEGARLRLARSNITGERSLADLTWAEQYDRGHLFEAVLDVRSQAASDHGSNPGNLKYDFRFPGFFSKGVAQRDAIPVRDLWILHQKARPAMAGTRR